jgi:hypothetical protein
MNTLSLLLITGTLGAPVPNLPEIPPIILPLHAAPAPQQALKYTLVPQLKDRKSGNAATLYFRAFSPEWWGTIQRDKDHWMKMDKWLAMPLSELPESEGVWIKSWKMLNEVDRAARRTHCDWEFTDRLREDGIGFLLPDVQGTRQLASFLSLRARLEMAEKNYDKAVYTFQTGFAMGQHITEGPTLIQGLVGAAITAIMLGRLEELIQQPDAPNMYWALTHMPRPFVNLRNGFEGESVLWTKYFPDLTELDKAPMSEEEALLMFRSLSKNLREIGENPQLSEDAHKAMLIGFVAISYPQAKERLIALGRSPKVVEAMPSIQVVLIDSLTRIYEIRDEMNKCTSLPYWEGRPLLKATEAKIRQMREKSKTDMITALMMNLLPAVEKVYFASARIQRKIEALRVIEAIRIYMAANKGALPNSLDDIKEVPVPLDPITGKSFNYLKEADCATLSAPPPQGEQPSQGNTIFYKLCPVKK